MDRVATFERRAGDAGDLIIVVKDDRRCIVDIDAGHVGGNDEAKGMALAHRIAAGIIEAGETCCYVRAENPRTVRIELVRSYEVGPAIALAEGAIQDLGFAKVAAVRS